MTLQARAQPASPGSRTDGRHRVALASCCKDCGTWGCPRDLSVCAQERLCGMTEAQDWNPGTTEYLTPAAGRILIAG